MNYYCSSYCNKAHRMSDGMPVKHECYIIPPLALEAERDGRYGDAMEIMDKAKPLPIARRGCNLKGQDREVADRG